MTTERIELINPVLGATPYVLIECQPDPESEAGFDFKVRAGGGPSGSDEITAMLLLVVETLTGVDTDMYIQQVDVARRAAGLPALSSAIEGDPAGGQ